MEASTAAERAVYETLLDAAGWLAVADIARAAHVSDTSVRTVLRTLTASHAMAGGLVMVQVQAHLDRHPLQVYKVRPAARPVLRERLRAALTAQ